MIDERTRRAHEIFVAALDAEIVDRDRLVRDECGGDDALRASVDRLLNAANETEGFLEAPAAVLTGLRQRPAEPARHRVRGYTILGFIGAGGMADVFRAEQERPKRNVALKIMRRSLLNTSAEHRFRFEVETLARLEHPGIAQIFEAGMCEDEHGEHAPFFAMEFVDGAQTITAHARANRLPLRRRLELFVEVCDAVQHGHQLGVIHRDIKPGNVLVGRAGRPKIIDFGIARSVQPAADRLTHHGGWSQVVGTLASMSPEQCGDVDRVDTRTDVYSLGVLLYELVTDLPPHDLAHAPLAEAVRIIQSVPPPRPRDRNPDAAGDLEAIIVMAMAKDPDGRYRGADSLAADVRRFLSHETIRARLPSPVHRVRLFARRRRMLAATLLVAAIVFLSLSAAIFVLGVQARSESSRRLAAEQTALRERDVARRQAYVADISSALLSYQFGEFARGQRRLQAVPEPEREWEWRLMDALIDFDEEVIEAHTSMVLAMDMAKSARRIATAGRGGDVALWDADSRRLIDRRSLSSEALPSAITLSPDGRFACIGMSDGAIFVWDTQKDAPPRIAATLPDAVNTLSHGSQDLIVSAGRDGRIGLWRLASDGALTHVSDVGREAHGACFSADGAKLVLWDREGSVAVIDRDTFQTESEANLGAAVEIARISDDGRVVAAGGERGLVQAWRTQDLAPLVTVPPDSASSIRSLALTADGSTIVAGRIDRTISMWTGPAMSPRRVGMSHNEAVSGLIIDDGAGRLISSSWDGSVRSRPFGDSASIEARLTLLSESENLLTVQFAPDGKLVAAAGSDGDVYLWDPVTGSSIARLTGHHSAVFAVRFSPDGEHMATASTDGTARLWSTLTGQPTHMMQGPGAPLRTVTFSPDGAQLTAAGDDGVALLWNLSDLDKPLRIEAHDTRIISTAFSPDGSLLATTARDGSVRLFRTTDGALVHSLQAHELDVFACAFTSAGDRILTGSRDQTVKIWDVQTGALIRTLEAPGHFITSVSIHPNGKRVAAGSWFGEAILWDLQTFDMVLSLRATHGAIRAIEFSPDGATLACVGHEPSVTLLHATPRATRRNETDAAQHAMQIAETLLPLDVDLSDTSARAAVLAADAATQPWVRNLALRRFSTPPRHD